MKSLVLLWQSMAADAAVQCRTSALRDIKRVTERSRHEGVGVLTLHLPEIGKAFERSLDQGQVTDDLLSLCGQKAGFPEFLRNFLRLVFDLADGRLLDDPSIDAIQAIRQLTLSFGKVLLPCSDAREKQAFLDYVKCEQELRDTVFSWDSETLRSFERISSMLFGDVFSAMDRDVYHGKIIPKHGPGATADRLKGNLKYEQREWTDRLESIFPAMENLIPSLSYSASLDELQHLDPGSERPVRVISVPKTLKTPRIIAVEPTCMQYMQQGLMEMLVKYLESPVLFNRSNVAAGMIGFTDQEPNQLAACEGSLYGELATLDLSEASDRVSLRLVHSMLFNYGHFLEAVLATRSSRADVPGWGVSSLVKYASMGSALTFPIEECVFLTCIFYGIQSELRRPLTRRDIKDLVGKVRVYGDDIIVPVEFVQCVVSALELFGFKVNRNKSFWNGSFRESCGKEYYAGHEVSIFRVRHTLPSRRTDATELISTVSLRNQAYKHGYWGTARYLDDIIRRLIPFPNVLDTSPVLGRRTFLGFDQERVHDDYQHPLVKGMVVRTRIPPSKVENEFALLKWFLKRGREPFADRNHLTRSGRDRTVGIKSGWACPY